MNPPDAAIGITTSIWLGLLDKLIKVSLRVLPFSESICGNPGAHDRSLFIQDAGVDYEHGCLDVGRARYIGNCPGLHLLWCEFFLPRIRDISNASDTIIAWHDDCCSARQLMMTAAGM